MAESMNNANVNIEADGDETMQDESQVIQARSLKRKMDRQYDLIAKRARNWYNQGANHFAMFYLKKGVIVTEGPAHMEPFLKDPIVIAKFKEVALNRSINFNNGIATVDESPNTPEETFQLPYRDTAEYTWDTLVFLLPSILAREGIKGKNSYCEANRPTWWPSSLRFCSPNSSSADCKRLSVTEMRQALGSFLEKCPHKYTIITSEEGEAADSQTDPQTDVGQTDRTGQTDDGPGQTDDGPGQTDDGPGQTDDRPGQTDDRPGQTDDPSGQTDDGPGQTEDGPGQTDDGPGQTDDGPGQTDDRPGQTDDRPGQTDDRPGQTDDRPGQTDDRPGQTDDGPGQTDDGPGQTDDGPGQTDDRPGQTDDRPGQTDDRPGQTDDPPGQTDDGPGQTDMDHDGQGQTDIGNMHNRKVILYAKEVVFKGKTDRNFLVTACEGVKINLNSLVSLRDKLSDEIIDCYMTTILRQTSCSFQYISCGVLSVMLSRNNQSAVADFEFVSNKAIGIYNIGRRHWVLSIIDFKKRTIIIIDPLGELQETLNRIHGFWINYLRLRGDAAVWDVATVAHTKQLDSTSCGVFCLMFASRYIEGEDLNIDPNMVELYRNHILETIMQNPDEHLLLKLCRVCCLEDPKGKRRQRQEETDWAGCDRCGMFWCHFVCLNIKDKTYSEFATEPYYCRFCI